MIVPEYEILKVGRVRNIAVLPPSSTRDAIVKSVHIWEQIARVRFILFLYYYLLIIFFSLSILNCKHLYTKNTHPEFRLSEVKTPRGSQL